jgi:hypothetical protein
MKRLLLIALTALICLTSCEYNNFEAMNPADVCDTLNMTYTKNIQPLLSANCGTNNTCHQSIGNTSDVPLVTYQDLMNVVLTGQFLSSVIHDGNAAQMPKGGGKLDDCKINTIKAWINQGSKE